MELIFGVHETAPYMIHVIAVSPTQFAELMENHISIHSDTLGEKFLYIFSHLPFIPTAIKVTGIATGKRKMSHITIVSFHKLAVILHQPLTALYPAVLVGASEF